MALPPINIPNVNYGSYARPEAVKVDVRGQLAIGQAIAQGFQAAASLVNAKMEANRKAIEEGQKKGDIESAKLASDARSNNLLQNTNILRDISADITSFEIQKSKDPSLNYTLEKQQLYGIVDNLNYLEDNVLDALPTDLTKDDFVDRKSFENYDQLRKLKTNETPLEYNKQDRDLTLYLNGQKTGLRDFVDNQDKFDYTKGLKYQIDGNTQLDALGKNFVKIAENYTKLDGNRKVLDYDRAASVIGDFPEIKDIIKNFGENIYNGYLRGDGEAFDPKNKDHISEVATLLIDRTLSNVPKDFGDVPVTVEEPKAPTSQQIKEAEAAQVISEIDKISSTENFLPLERITEDVTVKEGGWLGWGKQVEQQTKTVPVDVLQGKGFIELSRKLNSIGFEAKPIKGLVRTDEGEDESNVGLEIRNIRTGKKISLYDLSKYEEPEFANILKNLASAGTITGVMTQDGFNEEDLPPIINNQ